MEEWTSQGEIVRMDWRISASKYSSSREKGFRKRTPSFAPPRIYHTHTDLSSSQMPEFPDWALVGRNANFMFFNQKVQTDKVSVPFETMNRPEKSTISTEQEKLQDTFEAELLLELQRSASVSPPRKPTKVKFEEPPNLDPPLHEPASVETHSKSACANCFRLRIRCDFNRPCDQCVRRKCVDKCTSRPPTERKRRKVSMACANCSRLKIACDESRPCKRCVKSGKQDQCVDRERKKQKRRSDSPSGSTRQDSSPSPVSASHLQDPSFAVTFAVATPVSVPSTEAVEAWEVHVPKLEEDVAQLMVQIHKSKETKP
jgi:hypothetical protein